LPLLKNSSAFKNGLLYPSANIPSLNAGIASGFHFGFNPNPRVKTRGYNIAAPSALFYKVKHTFRSPLSDESRQGAELVRTPTDGLGGESAIHVPQLRRILEV